MNQGLRPRRPRARPRPERGFTLVELMVSLLVASLLVGMILAIFMRMSMAYRGQQGTTEVQDKLAAARTWIELDAKQAGYGMAQGFSIANDPLGAAKIHSPIEVIDSSTGPDTISFYYADPTAQALVASPVAGNWPGKLLVDSAAGFAAGDLIVLSTATLVDNAINPTTDGKTASFTACVLQVQSVVASSPTSTVFLSAAAPWGSGTQDHCTAPTAGTTMIYKFVARSYRIDPDVLAASDGMLQLSTTGFLNSATFFDDIAFGFTDLQVAGYFYDGDGIDTVDPDSDGDRDWHSDIEVQNLTDAQAKGTSFAPLLQVAVSLVARTYQKLEGIGTRYTPKLQDDTNVPFNMIGDHPQVDLSTTTDPHLQGNRMYRYTTFYADLRNMGVGR